MGTVELTYQLVRLFLLASYLFDWMTYRVGDDEDLGIGSSISSGLGEVTDDGSVGVEEV